MAALQFRVQCVDRLAVSSSKYPKRIFEHYGFAPVGRCIYCGTQEVALSKEHIIARAIGGNVTVAKASCAKCSAITRDVEQFCFRNMLGAFRIRMGFPTSRPKERPSKLPLSIIHTDKRVEIGSVEIPDHPAMLVMPTFSTVPHVLLGMHGTGTCGAWSFIVNPDAIKSHPEGTRVGGMPFHAEIFCRMLAKIAHAYAVADAGVNAFQPILPDFILGKTKMPVDYYIGCVPGAVPEEDTLHRVHLDQAEGNGLKYLTANIRLFAKFGAPQYHVAVGPLS